MRSAPQANHRVTRVRVRAISTAAIVALSALFALLSAGTARAASAFVIRGGGNGHGIGMSQYGALGYALHGYGYAAILAHYYHGTALGTVSPDRTVTVLLQVGSASFSGADTAGGTHRLRPGATYSVVDGAAGTLRLSSGGRTVGSFRAPLVVDGAGPVDLVGLGLYRGSLVFWPAPGGAVETVNSLGLEDYVRGVISAEMPPSWPAQALDAQAVAARTFAISVNPESSHFDVYPDTRSQMYRGVAAETRATNAAVAATSNQVVTYRGKPVVTYFFSSSGGHTESIQNEWPGATPEPWLVGVPDPYDDSGGNPFYRWTVDLSIARATASLGGLVKGSLVGIRVTKQGLSPRVLAAQVVGTRGTRTVTGLQLQQQFNLMSTYMTFATITTEPGGGGGSTSGSPSTTGGAGATSTGATGATGASAGRTGTGIHGTIFPATLSSSVQVQKLGRHGYATVVRADLAADGKFSAGLTATGSYRVLYDGIAGPAVRVAGRHD